MTNGLSGVSDIVCESMPVEKIKAILKSSPDAFFLVGGAMMGFPDLMADLLCFISAECHTVSVHKTIKTDFDVTWSPTEQQVNKGALNICMRMLEQDG
jgi:hypothetical protein